MTVLLVMMRVITRWCKDRRHMHRCIAVTIMTIIIIATTSRRVIFITVIIFIPTSGSSVLTTVWSRIRWVIRTVT